MSGKPKPPDPPKPKGQGRKKGTPSMGGRKKNRSTPGQDTPPVSEEQLREWLREQGKQ